MSDTQFDYIIIGGGTAGALLCNRLSASGRYRVLLVEAGRKDDYHWIHIPVGYLYCIGNPRTDWLYHTEPDAGLNGRTLRYPRGKTLGGCSSINGMIYMRGQSRDYDQWAQLTGEDEWRWEHCVPDFKQHEDHYKLDSASLAPDKRQGPISSEFSQLHGHGGEWRVEKQRLRWDVLDAFSAAAQEAGIPATDDFNRGDNEGVGYFEVNQRSGMKLAAWGKMSSRRVSWRMSSSTGVRARMATSPTTVSLSASTTLNGPTGLRRMLSWMHASSQVRRPRSSASQSPSSPNSRSTSARARASAVG